MTFLYLDETKRLTDNEMLYADAIKSSKAKVVRPITGTGTKILGYDKGLEELDRN
jgi:hypothetical protein